MMHWVGWHVKAKFPLATFLIHSAAFLDFGCLALSVKVSVCPEPFWSHSKQPAESGPEFAYQDEDMDATVLSWKKTIREQQMFHLPQAQPFSKSDMSDL